MKWILGGIQFGVIVFGFWLVFSSLKQLEPALRTPIANAFWGFYVVLVGYCLNFQQEKL